MSGMSFEGVAPTGGQYGFVRAGASVEFRAFDEPLADFLMGQIYSIARLSTFMPILMTQIGSYTTLTSCQVCPVSTSLYSCPYRLQP